MKVVILAGGKGSRISEESQYRPKPMVEIGGKPILWHIMKIYSAYGYDNFVICCGYKGSVIKKYFTNYYSYQADAEHDLKNKRVKYNKKSEENWKIILANTGYETLTAGRILKIRQYVQDEEDFMLTYGDGVSDIDINKLIDFHKSHGKLVTITTTKPPGRFGSIDISEDGKINCFREKNREDQSWVNTGFMVMNKKVFDYLGDGEDMLERTPFERLVTTGELMAFRHNGFWSPMDTIRDKAYLEQLWSTGEAPWKMWK